jgi:predicted PurR-regulated permease PerM
MSPTIARFIAVTAAVLLLRTAQAVLIPVAIAVLLSYAMAPLVSLLARRHLPRLAAAGLVVLLTFGGAAWAVYSLADQIVAATEALPQAAHRFRTAVVASRSGPTANLREALQQLRKPAAPDDAAEESLVNSVPYFGPVLVSGGLVLVGLVQQARSWRCRCSS